jgi:hypothetical protein
MALVVLISAALVSAQFVSELIDRSGDCYEGGALWLLGLNLVLGVVALVLAVRHLRTGRTDALTVLYAVTVSAAICVLIMGFFAGREATFCDS